MRCEAAAAQASVLIAAFALSLASPAAAHSLEPWQPMIADASRRFGVPSVWIERVMRAESGGATRIGGRPVVSPAGAMGLMQLMPATWADMRARLALGSDPHDPRDNILAGTLYLRLMYDRFGYPGLFAAYNAGPQRYAEHLASGRPLPAETRGYVAIVAGGPASPGRRARVDVRSARPGFPAGGEGIFFVLAAGRDPAGR